ncbi:MAG: efflux RND transporter periplasmic adaptor subunit [Nitrospinota bacterium]
MSKIKNLSLKLAPILIIALGVAALLALITLKPEIKEKPAVDQSLTVRTVKPKLVSYQPRVTSYGTVTPIYETELTSKLQGKVVMISSIFTAGEFFKRGDILFSIDRADYKAAVEMARSNLARKKGDLVREKAESKLANEELKTLGDKRTISPLAKREIQLNLAKADYLAAKASLDAAKHDLMMTTVKAPFDGRVKSQNIGLGQNISPNAVAGVIFPTSSYEIKLPVNAVELDVLGISSIYKAKSYIDGLDVTLSSVTYKSNNRSDCKIIRSEGLFDPKTRLINLVCQANDPHGFKDGKVIENPLTPGMFVEAKIYGNQSSEKQIKLPIEALRDNSEVYLLTKDNKLAIEKVKLVSRLDNEIIIAPTLKQNSKVIVSNISKTGRNTNLKELVDKE